MEPLLFDGETCELRPVERSLVTQNRQHRRTNSAGIVRVHAEPNSNYCLCENTGCENRMYVGDNAVVVKRGNVERAFCSNDCERQWHVEARAREGSSRRKLPKPAQH
jgi:hypothetical protein